jgi:Zn-dependent protease
LIPIAKAFNVKIYLDWNFLIFFGGLVLVKTIDSGVISGIAWMLVIAFLFGCIVLHEFGHVFAGRRVGMNFSRITLTMFGGMAAFEDKTMTAKQEFWMALGGPVVSAIIVGFFYGTAALIDDLSIKEFMQSLGFMNLYLLLLNIIPAFPMDGGRLFRSVLGFLTDFERATLIAVWVGRFCCVGLFVYSIYTGNFMLGIISVFIFLAGTFELSRVREQSLARH